MESLPQLDLKYIFNSEGRNGSATTRNDYCSYNDPDLKIPNSDPYRFLFSRQRPGLPKAAKLNLILDKRSQKRLNIRKRRNLSPACAKEDRIEKRFEKHISQKNNFQKNKNEKFYIHPALLKAAKQNNANKQNDKLDDPSAMRARKRSLAVEARIRRSSKVVESVTETKGNELKSMLKLPSNGTSTQAGTHFEKEKDRLVSENEKLRLILGKVSSKSIEKAKILMQLEISLRHGGEGFGQLSVDAECASKQKNIVEEKISDFGECNKKQEFKNKQLKLMHGRYRDLSYFAKVRNEKIADQVLHLKERDLPELKRRLVSVLDETHVLKQEQEQLRLEVDGARSAFRLICEDKRKEMKEKREIQKEKVAAWNRRRVIQMKPSAESSAESQKRVSEMPFNLANQCRRGNLISTVLHQMKAEVSKFQKTMEKIQLKTGCLNLDEAATRFFNAEAHREEIQNEVHKLLKRRKELVKEIKVASEQLSHVRSYGVESKNQVDDLSEREMKVLEAENMKKHIKEKADNVYDQICTILHGMIGLSNRLNVSTSTTMRKMNMKALVTEGSRVQIQKCFSDIAEKIQSLLSTLKVHDFKIPNPSTDFRTNNAAASATRSMSIDSVTSSSFVKILKEESSLEIGNRDLVRGNIRVRGPLKQEINTKSVNRGNSGKEGMFINTSCSSLSSSDNTDSDVDTTSIKDLINTSVKSVSPNERTGTPSRETVFNLKRKLSSQNRQEIKVALTKIFGDAKTEDCNIQGKMPSNELMQREKLKHMYKSKVFNRSTIKAVSGQLLQKLLNPKEVLAEGSANTNFQYKIELSAKASS